MNSFTASIPASPENLSLLTTLAYKYFFENGWAAVHLNSGEWICCDESCCLDDAMVFPDEESFVMWLEETAKSHLEDDPVEFLRLFCSVPELIDDFVAEAIMLKLG